MFLHAWIVHQLLARVYFEGFVVFTWTLDLCKNWMLDIYEISFTMCNPNSLCSFTESNYIVIWLLVFGFVGSAWSFGFFIPATTVNDLRPQRIFYPRFYPLHLFSYLNSWERASISLFNVQCPNKGTTGTIFITSLVCRGPWLGIEPGTFAFKWKQPTNQKPYTILRSKTR